MFNVILTAIVTSLVWFGLVAGTATFLLFKRNRILNDECLELRDILDAYQNRQRRTALSNVTIDRNEWQKEESEEETA